jgi:acetyltransferase-like isoleucine patch superfamily enzyme
MKKILYSIFNSTDFFKKLFKSYLLYRLFSLNEKFKKQLLFHSYIENVNKNLLEVGKYTYGATGIKLDHYLGSESKVTIGSYCSIAKDVRIITGGNHPPDWVALFPFRIALGLPGALTDGTPATKGPVNIENDVWIGTDVIILSGVTIGSGAIILAGAVVTKDVPPYSMAGGIPAKIVKKRFTEDQIEQLLKIKWWQWPEEKINEAIPLLSANTINEFINKYAEK